MACNRSRRHHRLNPQRRQRRCRLFHLRRTTHAVGLHPLKIVRRALRPALHLLAGVERGKHLVDNPGSLGGEHHFGGQRFDALDHHRADHLDRTGPANFRADAADLGETRRRQRCHRLVSRRPQHQQRHVEPRRIDLGKQRDIDKAPARRPPARLTGEGGVGLTESDHRQGWNRGHLVWHPLGGILRQRMQSIQVCGATGRNLSPIARCS